MSPELLRLFNAWIQPMNTDHAAAIERERELWKDL